MANRGAHAESSPNSDNGCRTVLFSIRAKSDDQRQSWRMTEPNPYQPPNVEAPVRSAPASLPTLDEGKVARGRAIVVGISIFLIAMAAVTVAIHGVLAGHGLINQLVRFAMVTVLCFLLYRGFDWVRYAMAFLFGLGGVMGLLALPAAMETSSGMLVALVAMMSIGYVVCAIMLAVSRNITQFMIHQRRTAK